jgi:hypothetical protein
MKKMFLVVIALMVSATTYTKAQEKESEIKRYGVLKRDHYGKHMGGLPQFLLGSDDVKPTALSFPNNTFQIYQDHWKNAYGTNDKAAVQAAAKGWTIDTWKGTDLEFYNTYKVGFFDQDGKLDYFRRTPHHKGDADGCDKDELFYYNSSGKIDGSDLCFNPVLLAPVKPVVPSGKENQYAGTTYIPAGNTNTNTISGGQGQPVIVINNIPPAVSQPVAQVQCPPQQSVVYSAPQQPMYAQQQQYAPQYAYQPEGRSEHIIVEQKRDFVDYANLVLNGANTWFNGVNTYRGIRFEQQQQTVYQGGRGVPRGRNYDNTWPNPTNPGNGGNGGGEFYGPTNPGRGFQNTNYVSANSGLGVGSGGSTSGGGYSNGW